MSEEMLEKVKAQAAKLGWTDLTIEKSEVFGLISITIGQGLGQWVCIKNDEREEREVWSTYRLAPSYWSLVEYVSLDHALVHAWKHVTHMKLLED